MSQCVSPPRRHRVRPPDVRLVRRAVRGDRAAAQELFRELQPIVLTYCVRRLGRENAAANAEDCAQEVLFAVLAGLPGYRYRTDKFLSWVFGIAAHKTADAHRVRNRERERFTPFSEPDAIAQWHPAAADEFARLVQQLQVQRALKRLPRLHGRVLTLRLLFGCSAEETAELLGMPSAAAVRVAQFRALRRLREVTQPAAG